LLSQGSLDQKFYYLDLRPDVVDSNGHTYKRNAILRWGPSNCFYEKDLYTTKFGPWQSTEIEEKFFGVVDSAGRNAVEYFANFQHPDVNHQAFNAMLPYMSIQKLRTPKGLAYLSHITRLQDKNALLFKMQEVQQIFCALWTECIWTIADASSSSTKFILSDHPVTVYNPRCFPGSKWCRDFRDPDIWLAATHTLFPLGLEKLLILTNLAWVRNPYQNPLSPRPNSTLFRPAMFNFMHIQTLRFLSDVEVNEINFVFKQRAYRYLASAQEEWLYPERHIPTQHWNKLGNGFLFMPDPRSVAFSTDITIGYKNDRYDWFDEYGRKPWEQEYNDQKQREEEWESFHAFQGEFARVFGPKRRGRTFEFDRLDTEEDSPDFHAYHLSLEQNFKTSLNKKRGTTKR